MKVFGFLAVMVITVLGQQQNPNLGLDVNDEAGLLELIPPSGRDACVLLKVTRPFDSSSIDSLHYSRGAKATDSTYHKSVEPAYKIFEIRAEDYFFANRILTEEHEVFGWVFFCAPESKRGYLQNKFNDTTFTNSGGYLMLDGLSDEQKKLLASNGYVNGRLTGGNTHIVEAQCGFCLE